MGGMRGRDSDSDRDEGIRYNPRRQEGRYAEAFALHYSIPLYLRVKYRIRLPSGRASMTC